MGFGLRPQTILLVRSEPALLRNIEDDPVRVLELALEGDVVLAFAEIEEERAAGALDALLGVGEVVDLEAEMVGADEAFGVLEAGAALALERQQRQIDHAVAQINARPDVEVLAADALEPEHALVERRGLLQILHRNRKV